MICDWILVSMGLFSFSLMMRLRVLQRKLIGFASRSNILCLPGGLNNLNRLTPFRCYESESIDVTVLKIMQSMSERSILAWLPSPFDRNSHWGWFVCLVSGGYAVLGQSWENSSIAAFHAFESIWSSSYSSQQPQGIFQISSVCVGCGPYLPENLPGPLCSSRKAFSACLSASLLFQRSCLMALDCSSFWRD